MLNIIKPQDLSLHVDRVLNILSPPVVGWLVLLPCDAVIMSSNPPRIKFRGKFIKGNNTSANAFLMHTNLYYFYIIDKFVLNTHYFLCNADEGLACWSLFSSLFIYFNELVKGIFVSCT